MSRLSATPIDQFILARALIVGELLLGNAANRVVQLQQVPVEQGEFALDDAGDRHDISIAVRVQPVRQVTAVRTCPSLFSEPSAADIRPRSAGTSRSCIPVLNLVYLSVSRGPHRSARILQQVGGVDGRTIIQYKTI